MVVVVRRDPTIIVKRPAPTAVLKTCNPPKTLPVPPASVTRVPTLPNDALKEGALLSIGGHELHMGPCLGKGGFGCVWSAFSSKHGGEVAVKEIVCGSPVALMEAEAEGHCLSALRTQGVSQVPTLWASDIQQIGPTSWRVRLLMQKIPGEALDKFIRNKRSTGAVGSLANLKHVASFTGSMLWQISEILKGVSPYFFHRDAHPRNMLVDNAEGDRPAVGLIDYGLAVRTQAWKQRAWQSAPIGGDCRYWPASAWLMFTCGPTELKRHPLLRQEYENRLDFHTVGLSGVQLIVEMVEAQVLTGESPPGPLDAKLQELCALWQRYWIDSTRFWKDVSGVPKEKLSAVRHQCAKAQVVDITLRNIRALKRCLCDLRDVTRLSGDCGASAMTRVIHALLVLISAGDGAGTTHAWEHVQMLVHPCGEDCGFGDDACSVQETTSTQLPQPACYQNQTTTSMTNRRIHGEVAGKLFPNQCIGGRCKVFAFASGGGGGSGRMGSSRVGSDVSTTTGSTDSLRDFASVGKPQSPAPWAPQSSAAVQKPSMHSIAKATDSCMQVWRGPPYYQQNLPVFVKPARPFLMYR